MCVVYVCLLVEIFKEQRTELKSHFILSLKTMVATSAIQSNTLLWSIVSSLVVQLICSVVLFFFVQSRFLALNDNLSKLSTRVGRLEDSSSNGSVDGTTGGGVDNTAIATRLRVIEQKVEQLAAITNDNNSSLSLRLDNIGKRLDVVELTLNLNGSGSGGSVDGGGSKEIVSRLRAVEDTVKDVGSNVIQNTSQIASLRDQQSQLNDTADAIVRDSKTLKNRLNDMENNVTDVKTSVDRVDSSAQSTSSSLLDTNKRLNRLSTARNYSIDSFDGIYIDDADTYFDIAAPLQTFDELFTKMLSRNTVFGYDFLVLNRLNFSLPEGKRTTTLTLNGIFFIVLSASTVEKTVVLVLTTTIYSLMTDPATDYLDSHETLFGVNVYSASTGLGISCIIGSWKAADAASYVHAFFGKRTINGLVIVVSSQSPSVITNDFRDNLLSEALTIDPFNRWGFAASLDAYHRSCPFCVVWSSDLYYGRVYSVKQGIEPNTDQKFSLRSSDEKAVSTVSTYAIAVDTFLPIRSKY